MRTFITAFITIISASFTFSQASYEDILTKERSISNEKMFGKNSILDSTEQESFIQKEYFDIDTNYRVSAKIIVDKGPKFKMETSTERKPKYRRFGYVEFRLNDSIVKLAIYSNLGYNKKTKTKNYLFLPVKDATAPNQTYGAGRYLDLIYKNEYNITLDFNKLYNPYCAYSHHYSCPITPSENRIKVSILAGEKLPKFKN